MIVIKKGSLLDSTSKLIAHQVNCKGAMGFGVARYIRDRYPKVFNDYREFLRLYEYDYNKVIGRVNISICEDRIIANMFSQNGYRRYGDTPNTIYTEYDAFSSCCNYIKHYCISTNQPAIAMPYRIGCGAGGGDWNVIYDILCKYFEMSENITLELWRL